MTITSGKTMRMPKTAIAIPQVKKRRCQTGSMSLSTEALTAALSKESETSRTARTAHIQRMPRAPSTVPVSSQPYQPPKASAKTVKISDPPKCLNIEKAFCHTPLKAKISLYELPEIGRAHV